MALVRGDESARRELSTVGSCHFSCQRGIFPQVKSLKPLVAALELWWGSNEIFGMPKGGLDMRCSLVFARVLLVLKMAPFCSLRVLFYR
jgi:hypothetical protein